MIIQETLSSSNHVGITTNGMILGMLQYLIANILSTFFFLRCHVIELNQMRYMEVKITPKLIVQLGNL
jgi:hypothetical protein